MPSIVSPFTVAARPAEPPSGEPPMLGRTTFDKEFTGPLLARGVVEMTYAAGPDGPLAYVALERIEGELDGRRGSFVLQHVGSTAGGEHTIALTVLPRSGTGDLVGLEGSGTIVHLPDGPRLELDYELA